MAPITQRSFYTTMGRVDWTRPEIVALAKYYQTIQDCIAGEIEVKRRKTLYLPQPNATDLSKENQERYHSYITRAVFYNVTKRTLNGLVGQVFLRDPQVEIPTSLDPLKVDATGAGVNLTQLSKRMCNLTIGFGRCGLLVDYPRTNGGVTQADIASGDLNPQLIAFDPWEVINWRTIIKGSRILLSLVVIREANVISDDGFEVKFENMYRVLRLTPDFVYTVEFWKRMNNGGFTLHEGPYTPLDASGKPWNEIPFKFIGCNDNDTTVDHPPLYDLAALNIAHYRNSADYEEAAYIVGQPTPYFAGLTEQWVKEVLKGAVQLGARAAIPLPEGGSAGLLQASPNTMPKEAMEAKERQMVALGAKLVEQKSIQRTATEADLENSAESSTLATSAKNVAEGVQWGLQQADKFQNATPTAPAEIKFSLNTEFDLTQMGSDERAELIKEWQSNAITFGEMRAALRRAGIATMDDDEALAKIKEESTLIPSIVTANPPPIDPNAPPAKPPVKKPAK